MKKGHPHMPKEESEKGKKEDKGKKDERDMKEIKKKKKKWGRRKKITIENDGQDTMITR